MKTSTQKYFPQLLLSLILNLSLNLYSQAYPPAAGLPGSTALNKDSSIFVNWASACLVQRGYQDISNTALGLASAGDSSAALGKAGLNGVLSLGDGGLAICTFPFPIKNGAGFDFAVFENAFDNSFLELAFVEVSSDGQNYFPFPAHSLTDTLAQVSSFDPLDATKLNNLAGKYRANFGTPFDLQELSGNPGLDLEHITHVKLRDVVGSLQNNWCSRDAFGNKVNDPWPTPFPSSGFDLDAVGVIHQNVQAALGDETEGNTPIKLFPNPATSSSVLQIETERTILSAELISSTASVQKLKTDRHELYLPELQSGLYLLRLISESSCTIHKLLIR